VLQAQADTLSYGHRPQTTFGAGRPAKAGAIGPLFERFDATLRQSGYIAMSGQIVDASLIAAPRPRNTQDEKKAIKDGRIPDAGKDKPAKLRALDSQAVSAASRLGVRPKRFAARSIIVRVAATSAIERAGEGSIDDDRGLGVENYDAVAASGGLWSSLSLSPRSLLLAKLWPKR
jgi:hypothetical protein